MGLMATLEHMGRVTAGPYAPDTPVGTVQVQLRGKGLVGIDNVPAYRHLAGEALDVPGFGAVTGDVAWGDNWFFLCNATSQSLRIDGVEELSRCCAWTWCPSSCS